MKQLGRVAVGMSGGVDSSVTAAMLVEQGYEVAGVYLECWNEPGCRTDQDRGDALKVALELGIPYTVLDYEKEYREQVVEYFYDTYRRGLTPNPDVLCNKEIKFGMFMEWAIAQGFDAIATGHYARIVKINGRKMLQRGLDKGKDQSYFLYRLKEEQLDKVIFPLGQLKKGEVRKKAKKLELHVADKPDSTGICFIGDVDVSELLNKRLGEDPGEVLYRGEVVGVHRGLWFYTKGQRGGFTLDKKKLAKMGELPQTMKPLFVVEKDIENNGLIVGYKEETYSRAFWALDLSWVNGQPKSGEYLVRIRNLGKLYPSFVEIRKEKMEVSVKEKIMGVAAGQSAVIYQSLGKEGGEVVLGGGVIV